MIQAKKQAHKVALVTGAARRIGKSIAETLHEQGFNIAIHCNKSRLDAEALAHILNNNRPDSAVVFSADFKNRTAPHKLILEVEKWAGRLDVLINNASLFLKTDCNAFNEEDWHSLFIVNTEAPFLLSLAAYPLLKEQQGAIINITDIHAEKPLKGYAAYCQSKAALLMQTKALAREFAPMVRVNAVAPGAIAWPEDTNQLSENIKRNIINQTPLARHGDPLFIAQAVLSLIENPFITGQTLSVDGGRSI